MDADRFWTLIEASREGIDTADPASALDGQVEGLRTSLATEADEELLAFQQRLGEQAHRANAWPLWAAGYLAFGGMSDDAFDYFRLWLVLQGRTTFDRLLTDPDSLADLPWDPDGEALGSAEALAYLVEELLDERDVEPDDTFPTATPAGEPSGTPFDEDDDGWFAATFPQLWARVEATQDS